MPMSIEDLVRRYYKTRVERLALDKQSAIMAEIEKSLIAQITKLEPHSFTTNDFAVSIVKTPQPFVEDWPKLMEYIKETGEIDLFEKRLLKSAAQLRFNDDKKIPGVKLADKTEFKVEPNV